MCCLFLYVCIFLCVCAHECADKCLPGQWPEESEAKLGHLVLQPGTDQSALSRQLSRSLCLSFSPLSPPYAHTYPPTHWQTGLGSVQSQRSSDGLCEAAMLEATGATHCSTMTCWLRYFSVQGRIWCQPSPSAWKMKSSFVSLFPVRHECHEVYF